MKKQKQTMFIPQQINYVDELVDKKAEILAEMDRNLDRLKLIFKTCIDEMGEITKQDVDYNIDNVSRLMYKKFNK